MARLAEMTPWAELEQRAAQGRLPDGRVGSAAVAGLRESEQLSVLHLSALELLVNDHADRLTPGLRALTVLRVVGGEVDNGGFVACLYNQSAEYTDLAIESAQLIGATRHAAVFRRFADIVAGGAAMTTISDFEERLNELTDNDVETLDELDQAYFALDSIDGYLETYIAAHRFEFFAG